MLKLVFGGAGVLAACALALAGPAHAARMRNYAPGPGETQENSLLDELNFARTHPADYARVLLEEAASTRSAYSSFAYEDPRALNEAVDFLLRQQPLPPLRADAKLDEAALSYAAVQGRQGGVGHNAMSQSLGQRIQSHGVRAMSMGEDISYGYSRPRDVVRQLIVDAGVPDRGHRKNIFSTGYNTAGVGCGPHRVYGSMCVVDFAGGSGRG